MAHIAMHCNALIDPRDYPQAISWARGWISQYLPRFGGARIQSLVGMMKSLLVMVTCVTCDGNKKVRPSLMFIF